MLVSLSWLQEFVPYAGSAQQLGDRLTMLGLELDGIVRPFEGIECIIVGHVVACEKHPEAEKLSVCKVDVGTEVLDIVCGAPNVRTGLKVAVVKVGSTLPNGLTIKSAKLRGLPSNGMICSEAELGLSEEHDGIMELPEHVQIGTRLVDALKLDQEVLDISITPNRGDCLSVLGIARETALAFDLPLTLPRLTLHESSHLAKELVSLEIADKDLCPVYQTRVLENAPSAKSPDWMRFRLHAVGIRSIFNHVDVTNYVMMELGQPLHAFDLDIVKGGKVIIAPAKEGELFVTLDGAERKLLASDLTIRDTERAIALAGVMGGQNTEVSASTSRVLLECAIFNPSSIRRTARRLNMHSDASYRFERGVDQVGSAYALERAAQLMAELSGGSVCKGVVKAEPKPWQASTVTLRKSRTVSLLGVGLTTPFCVSTLQRLGCNILSTTEDLVTDPANTEVWDVATPSFRPDLTRESDLIEELVRVYGVDRIPAVLPAIIRPLDRAGLPEPIHAFRVRVKNWASGLGLNEAINYSFVSHKELDFLGMAQEGRISIMNPLSDEMNVLRPHLVPGLLQNLRTNISQGAAGGRLFEVATSFVADAASETTANETMRLGIMLYGNRFDAAWPQTQADLDYQDLKGFVEHLATYLHLPAPQYAMSEVAGWLAPCVTITINGKEVGFAGKVRGNVADAFHARKDVWIAELYLDTLYEMHLSQKVQYEPLAMFPPVRRDITFMVAPGVQVDAIIDVVNGMNVPLLEHVRLIDFFEPKGTEEKNLTYRLTFRHKDRTLKDNEVDKQRDAIAKKVIDTLGARV